MTPEDITRLIQAGFPGARVEVAGDDGTHFAATVVAGEFAGVGRVGRHQMVYRSLGDLVGGEIHALSITALTPEEWAARASQGR